MNNIDKKLVEAIRDTFETNVGEREFKERIKKIDVKIPGILEIYDNILKEEKENSEQKLKDLCIELGNILDPINKEICNSCKDCCCKDCWYSHGHFQNICDIKQRKEFEERARKYNWTEKGFLGDNGCKLPRYLRSNTCLRHICGKIDKELEKIEKQTEVNSILSNLYNLSVKYSMIW